MTECPGVAAYCCNKDLTEAKTVRKCVKKDSKRSKDGKEDSNGIKNAYQKNGNEIDQTLLDESNYHILVSLKTVEVSLFKKSL